MASATSTSSSNSSSGTTTSAAEHQALQLQQLEHYLTNAPIDSINLRQVYATAAAATNSADGSGSSDDSATPNTSKTLQLKVAKLLLSRILNINNNVQLLQQNNNNNQSNTETLLISRECSKILKIICAHVEPHPLLTRMYLATMSDTTCTTCKKLLIETLPQVIGNYSPSSSSSWQGSNNNSGIIITNATIVNNNSNNGNNSNNNKSAASIVVGNSKSQQEQQSEEVEMCLQCLLEISSTDRTLIPSIIGTIHELALNERQKKSATDTAIAALGIVDEEDIPIVVRTLVKNVSKSKFVFCTLFFCEKKCVQS